jgi:hypothetical protein
MDIYRKRSGNTDGVDSPSTMAVKVIAQLQRFERWIRNLGGRPSFFRNKPLYSLRYHIGTEESRA